MILIQIIKIDFNTLNTNCRFYNPFKTRLQAFRELYKLYREEMKEDTYLVSCSGFNRGTFGYVDASRIGPDSCHIWSAAHPCTILESIRTTGMNALANNLFFSNDPDVSYLKTRGSFNPIAGDITEKVNKAVINEQAIESLGNDFHVWSFWDEKYLGTGISAIQNQEIIPHGNLTLKLTPPTVQGNKTLLIGSSLHISMGAAEIKDFAATETTVDIILSAAGARNGSIYLYSLQPLSLVNVTGCLVDAIEKVDDHVWKVVIMNRIRAKDQKISLVCNS